MDREKPLKFEDIPDCIIDLMLEVAETYKGVNLKKPAVGFHVSKKIFPPRGQIAFNIICYEYPNPKAEFPRSYDVSDVIKLFRKVKVSYDIPGTKEPGFWYLSIEGKISRYLVDVSFEQGRSHDWPPIIFDTWSMDWTVRVPSRDDSYHGIVDFRASRSRS